MSVARLRKLLLATAILASACLAHSAAIAMTFSGDLPVGYSDNMFQIGPGTSFTMIEVSEVTYCNGPYSCAEGADALVIVTEWEQFRALDLGRLKQAMAHPVIIDLRNIYRPEEVTSHGFRYESVGRVSEKAQITV